MILKRLAENLGKGLVAGLAGTAAMTAVSTLEMKIRGRESSTTPADAAMKVFGLQERDEESKEQFSNAVHWAYGTVWGAARGIIASTGLKGAPASAVHFAAVWGAALVMLPALKVAPPPSEWGAEELAIDALHHLVYVSAAGTAFDLLDDAP